MTLLLLLQGAHGDHRQGRPVCPSMMIMTMNIMLGGYARLVIVVVGASERGGRVRQAGRQTTNSRGRLSVWLA